MKQARMLFVLLLIAALLCGCGAGAAALPTPEPENTESPAPAENIVTVTDVAGLLAALGDDRVIELDCARLRLQDAPDYGFSYSDGPYTWLSLYGGEYMLWIRDLSGLTIRGAREEPTEICTNALYADVLRFENCTELTLEGLTLGHSPAAEGCAGNVLELDACDRATLRGCELYGCGVIGLNAINCLALRAEDCLIRDCTMAALNITCCTDFQARDCEILRCGASSPLAALCAASCNGFALINCRISDCDNTFLLDAMNSPSVCLLGCEASGCRFSNALFCLYDDNITVSGCVLSGNEFGSCYGGGAWVAVNGSGQELITFGDFARMEHKPFTGEYVGPAPSHPTPQPQPETGERQEIHVSTVDELLGAIAPYTTIYLDAEEFDLSTASDYGQGRGGWYSWVETYDGPELQLHDLEGLTLVGGGMGVTLLSAVPRYADVLSFENCRDISLEDMTLGHRIEPGYCSGDVLELDWCEGVSVTRCGLFGCGEVGINASCCSSLAVTETNIYDCSYLGAQLDRVQDAQFTACSVTDCGGEYGFNGFMLSGCSGVFYDAERLYDGPCYIGAMG